MELASGLWPIIKITLAFVAMLASIRMRLSVWISILIGSFILAVLFGLSPFAWAKASVIGLFDIKAFYLAFIVWSIMALSAILEKCGQTERLMEAMRGYLRSPRLGLAFFPALIGLLPMPGGAVFSAPMVKTQAAKMGLSPVDKAVVNYWYRHIWELGWPLYPGILLAASLADVPLTTLVGYTVPGVALCLLLGWVFILRPGRLKIDMMDDAQVYERDFGKVFQLGLPIIIAIVGAIGFELLMSIFTPDADYEIGVLVALVISFGVAVFQNRIPVSKLGEYLVSKHLLNMVLVIAAIFVFKGNLARAGVVEQLAGLAGGDAAIFTAAVFLPFLVGFVAGISVAFVGATFPLLLGLVEQLGLGDHLMSYMVLGMFSGYSGVMVSPIHICFVITCQYFHVPLSKTWRRTALPSFIILAAGFCYFLILR